MKRHHSFDLMNIANEFSSSSKTEIFFSDLTDKTASSSNWHIVRVIAPNALPRESSSLYPHNGGKRILNTLNEMNISKEYLNNKPHSFG